MADAKGVVCHKRLTVYGAVQGVGFRPYAAGLARSLSLRGSVRNVGGFAEIIAIGPAGELERFLAELKCIKLPFAKIDRIDISDAPDAAGSDYMDFIIEDSAAADSAANIFVPADLPVCGQCLAEAYDRENRRYKHPFISCSSCGPRYSIIKELPYDRGATSMADFPMCGACRGEYAEPDDRRLHAQTISCHGCGPYLIFERGDRRLAREAAFEEAVIILKSGGIVAVKGVGGFHFAVSPYGGRGVGALRELKSRENKPFAVMFSDMAGVTGVCAVSEAEKTLLTSPERPIVLLDLKDPERGPFSEAVLAGSPQCGCLLPYTPLHHMLLAECGPLVMTSANVSGSPIIKDDGVMLDFGRSRGFGVLYSGRAIIRSVEDSVAKDLPAALTPAGSDKNWQLIRRARGYTPNPIFIAGTKPGPLFAAGGDLKSAFCLLKNGCAYVSQYLGDLESYEANAAYRDSVRELCGLFNITPGSVVCDLHPRYFSSGFSAEFAGSLGVPVKYVQHHHAHAASVMAEHGLFEALGVVFDGTGYGADGNIWGGEFLCLRGGEFERLGHLEYVDVIGGDASVGDTLKTLDCFLHHAGFDAGIADGRPDSVKIIKRVLDNRINVHKTSSAGRLFDAAAAFLNIKHENSYEGECAVLLENSARLALRYNEAPLPLRFDIGGGGVISHRPVFEALLSYDAAAREKPGFVRAAALGFHMGLSRAVADQCALMREERGINAVVLSGGVFQNDVLLSNSAALLKGAGFEVFVNRQVPANDGGISLGQAFLGGL